MGECEKIKQTKNTLYTVLYIVEYLDWIWGLTDLSSGLRTLCLAWKSLNSTVNLCTVFFNVSFSSFMSVSCFFNSKLAAVSRSNGVKKTTCITYAFNFNTFEGQYLPNKTGKFPNYHTLPVSLNYGVILPKCKIWTT